MKRTLPVTLGVVMFVVGAVFSLQGMGYLAGSPMTGSAFWAIAGAAMAGLGVALALTGFRRDP